MARRRISSRAAFVALLAATLGGCVPFATPAGPVVADRPGYTDAPTVLPARAIQAELGVTSDRVDNTTYVSSGEMLIRLGVGARTELRYFANSYGARFVDGNVVARGFEDPKVGLKVNLRAVPDTVHEWFPNISFLAATTLPVQASRLGTLRPQPEGKIAANWTTPTPFSAYTNLGYGGTYDDTQWGSHAWASLALWYALHPRVSVFGEGLAVGLSHGSASSGNNVDAGVTFLMTERLQLDVRVGRGVGAVTSHERFLGVGFAQRW
ncbi:MAG: transporter [bacterium]